MITLSGVLTAKSSDLNACMPASATEPDNGYNVIVSGVLSTAAH